MSPEYALDGKFSDKSDVYSFGVLVLEIVSGIKMGGFFDLDPDLNLLRHVSPSFKQMYNILPLDTVNHNTTISTSRHGHSIKKESVWNCLIRQQWIRIINQNCSGLFKLGCCVCNHIQKTGQACPWWLRC